MDIQDLLTYAKQQYNAVGDDFFPDAQLYKHVEQAQLELATAGLLIEDTLSTTTVAGQQEYSFPATCIAVRRVTYDGQKLMPIDLRDADTVTVFTSGGVAATGTPQYYSVWEKTFALWPTPDAAEELKVWAYCEPQSVDSTSTLAVPSEFHIRIADYLLEKMAAKDKNFQAATYYAGEWAKTLAKARSWARKRRTGDALVFVRDEEKQYQTLIGAY